MSEDVGLVPKCMICDKQRPVYFLPHADALVCKKCIRRAGGEDKITYETISGLAASLNEKRMISKRNNLPFVPTCPNGMDHKDIYPEDYEVMFCDDCGTFFWQVKDGTYHWDIAGATSATFKFLDSSLSDVEVSVDEINCPLDNCHMCGRLLPDKELSYYTNQETNETELVVCDRCNAIDKPVRRGRNW